MNRDDLLSLSRIYYLLSPFYSFKFIELWNLVGLGYFHSYIYAGYTLFDIKEISEYLYASGRIVPDDEICVDNY